MRKCQVGAGGALTRKNRQPSEHTVHQHSAAEGSGSSLRTWQRRPQRKTETKTARGARYEAKAPERQQALTACKAKQCVAVRAGYGYVTVIITAVGVVTLLVRIAAVPARKRS